MSYEKNISATVDNQHTPAQSIDEEHQWLNPSEQIKLGTKKLGESYATN